MKLPLCAGAVAAMAFTIAASAQPAATPHLVAVGGALKGDNEAVYGALLARHETNTIVIVPYSSADAPAAAESVIAAFKKRRPDADYRVMPDSSNDDGSRTLAAEMVARADLVYFTGGDQSRLIPRFYDHDAPNAVLLALRDGMTRSGTVVGGSSAGCACLSDPMFTGGASEDALGGLTSRSLDDPPGTPDTPAVRIGRGLGLIQGVLMDSHTMQRGRWGRMIAALEKSGQRFAVGVNENRAVVADGDGVFTGVGDGAAVIVDIGDTERDGLTRRGVRVSLLGDGDRFRLSPTAGEKTFEPRFPAAPRVATGQPAPEVTEELEAWGKSTLQTMIRRLAADPESPQTARSPLFAVTLSADERTRFSASDKAPGSLSVFDARLDIIELPPAPRGAAAGLLIVAPRALAGGLGDFVKAKQARLPTRLVVLEDALAAQPGADDAEKLKRFLHRTWRQDHTGSVLLVGDADVLPVRYMVLDRNHTPAFDYAFYPSDLYYADVARPDGSFDDWNARKDGFHAAYFGEVRGEHNKPDPINYDQIDYRPELAVGRWPVSTAAEAAAVAAKTIAYERALDEGKVPARAGLVCTGGWVDARGQLDAFGGRLKGWALERRYYKDGPAFDTPPPSEAEVLSLLRGGAGLVLHAGHGSDHVWDGCLSSNSIASMANAPEFPVMISAGCSTARFATLPPYEGYEDAAGVEHKGTNDGEVFTAPPPPPACYAKGPHNFTGLGEMLVRSPDAGAIVYIGCNTGSQPCGLTLEEGFVDALAADPHATAGECWKHAVSYYYDHQKLATIAPTEDWYPASIFFQGMKFMFYGDPTVHVARPR